jgi:hypothetical protein
VLEIYACTALICAASVLVGSAILILLGWPRPLWLAGATGFAALVTVAPFLVRLPGRATTAAILLALALAACAYVLLRDQNLRGPQTGPDRPSPIDLLAPVAAVALASLPFLFQDHIGVLGEGIYINDHAAQLYWAEWLRDGFGPEPSAVAWGYPIGPQALTAVAATALGADLISAFNGLLFAITALTATAALSLLGRLATAPRVAVAALSALPYLAASFLAQSAFKETAMALFVLAFAAALQSLRRAPGRAVVVVGVILAAGSLFTYSLPGLAWFALALVIWFGLEIVADRSPVDLRGLRTTLGRHRALAGVAVAGALVVAVLAIGPAISFIDKINDVQESQGRLGSPISPGEVFGIWPEGDYRIVRGDVSGSLVAAGIGFLAAAFGAWVLVRRRQFALLAMLAAGFAVYIGARLFAEIHVEAKALAVIAPLVLLVALRALFDHGDGDRSRGDLVRYAVGAAIGVAALVSTLLALRATPVGFDDRGQALEHFTERIDGDSVAFLGVDRFAGYYLRGTLARAPAGYVPEEVATRDDKPWFQGNAADFDTLDAGKLGQFDYAITTDSAYNSLAPANFEPIDEARGYVLWKRSGDTPRARIASPPKFPWGESLTTEYEVNGPGGTLACDSRLVKRGGTALVRGEPATIASTEWDGKRVKPAVGGQENGFTSQRPISGELELPRPGRYEISLQYHSQMPLTVLFDGEPVGELPPSLEGMYLDGAGGGAFWSVGEIDAGGSGEVEVVPADPSGLGDALGVEQRAWLGGLAATPIERAEEVDLKDACGRYVDHFTLARGGGGSDG